MESKEIDKEMEQENLIIDKDFQEKISKVSAKLRGKEMEILDDFCKCYYAAEMFMTGKDFMSIVSEVCLNVQTSYQGNGITTKYWFSPKEKN